jgi:hypothetical protein
MNLSIPFDSFGGRVISLRLLAYAQRPEELSLSATARCILSSASLTEIILN